MIDKSVKKSLVIAVIILFISVSFQPVFADELSEKVTVEDEKIEYTIEIIKTNKVIENKVYLSKQQADELENLIENIRVDLNNSETQEETKEIYNNAINSFNKMDLFPENITIDEIKQLVYGETQNLDSIRFKNETFDGFKNFLCFVSGDSCTTFFLAPALLFLTVTTIFTGLLISDILDYIFINNDSSILILFFYLMISVLLLFPGLILFLASIGSIFSIIPISIGAICSLGIGQLVYYGGASPAFGWISTLGLKGKKNYSGGFFGSLVPSLKPLLNFGILGFTGIHIHRKVPRVFYLGFALEVGISTDY